VRVTARFLLRSSSLKIFARSPFVLLLLVLLLLLSAPFLSDPTIRTQSKMAANPAAAAGAAARQQNEHVEFSVKAAEDLYLEGSCTTIRRVTAETNYSCLMLKTQRFSSLFRHYAKYHGLRKDELEYYFVNMLENEDTPESVQLQRGDTIMVSAS